jgi:hypothetical protein
MPVFTCATLERNVCPNGRGYVEVNLSALVCRCIPRRHLPARRIRVESWSAAPFILRGLSKVAIHSEDVLFIDILAPQRAKHWYTLIKKAPTLLRPIETRRFVLTYVAGAEWPKRRPIALCRDLLRQPSENNHSFSIVRAVVETSDAVRKECSTVGYVRTSGSLREGLEGYGQA